MKTARLFSSGFLITVAGLAIVAQSATVLSAAPLADLSPAALAAAPNGETLYVACSTANRVMAVDTRSRKVVGSIEVPESPSGLALTPDGRTLYVTCAAPKSVVCVIDTARAEVIETIPAGHTAVSPALSPDGRTLYVCNRFDNETAFIDVGSGKTIRRAAAPREPVAAALTPDGKLLFVSNHLHAGRADADTVASSVTVITTDCGEATEIALPNGSGLLRETRVSPDGRYAAVAHQISRFHLPTTQLDRGWVNTSAISLIDVRRVRRINTVLLDNIDAGAANPWAVAWSADGRSLFVTHAGTHELSVIDFPKLLAKLEALPDAPDPSRPEAYAAASQTASDVPNDLSFLVGLRRRIQLPESDRGPRALALIGTQAWIANYFTDSLSVVDVAAVDPAVDSLPLQAPRKMSAARRGEMLFNDATLCFQGWQSCASCHSSDARVDGLNWDNLNDGIGNPKNVKSLLLAHSTPPMMWLGVRENASVAVRAGIRHALFMARPPEDAEAIDDYLKSLRPIASPRRIDGRLSPAALRGKELFFSKATRCADCHEGELYTDLKRHKVGTSGKFDQPTDRFDTPSLIELWRTSPYLHDGRAATVIETLTTFNSGDLHGVTSHLTPEEIADLAEFVLSL